MFQNKLRRNLLIANILALALLLLLLYNTEPTLHLLFDGREHTLSEENAPAVDLEYVVRVPGRSPRHVQVKVTVRGHKAGQLRFRALADDQGYLPRIHVEPDSLRARSGDPGGDVELQIMHTDFWLPEAPAGAVEIEYEVRPGALAGRNHLGYVDAEAGFGVLPGQNLFMVPVEPTRLRRVQVRFELPEGWTVATPWEVLPSGYHVIPEGDLLRVSLRESVIGLGRLARAEKEIGGTKVEVCTFSDWPAAKRQRLAENVWQIYAFQQHLFGAAAGSRYLVVLTPGAAKGRHIWGGAGNLGQGLDLEDEKEAPRWELLAHRLHYVWNRDRPFGMRPAKPENGWWQEATATYYEPASVLKTSLFRPDQKALYRSLYWTNRYRDYLQARLSGDLDGPVSKDYQASKEVRDFLHHTKAPLVAAAVDAEIRRLTGGHKTLRDLLAYQYQHAGQYQGQFDPAADVQALTGQSWNDFFQRYVNGTELLPPPQEAGERK